MQQDVVINFGAKYKATIEKMEECHQCVIVDDIVVPHCDCERHGGFIGVR